MRFPHRRRDCRVRHHPGRNGIIDTPIFDQLAVDSIQLHNAFHSRRKFWKYVEPRYHSGNFPFRDGGYATGGYLPVRTYQRIPGTNAPCYVFPLGAVYTDDQPVPGDADYAG